MLKKKNIAMVMAAATVATSVAPVFALEAQTVTKEELVKVVKEKLAVKYSGKDAKSVYEITVNGKEITTVADLEKELEMAEVKGKEVTAKIVDKGHVKNSDGEIVDVVNGKSYEDVKKELSEKEKQEAQKTVDTAKAAVDEKLNAAKTAVDGLEVAAEAAKTIVNSGTGQTEVGALKTAATEAKKAVDAVDSSTEVETLKTAATEAKTKVDAVEEKLTEAKVAVKSQKGETEVNAVEGKLTEAKKAVVALEEKVAELKKAKEKLDGLNGIDGNANIDFVAKEMLADNKAIDKVIALDVDGKECTIKIVGEKVEYKDSESKPVTSEKIKNIKVILKSGVELIVNEKTAQLDLTKGLDKDRNDIYIDRADEETAKRVVDFKFVEVKEGAKTADIPSRVVANMTTKANSLTKEEFNLSTFKTEKGYTEAGKELVGLLKLASDQSKSVTTTRDGKVYQVRFNQNSKDNLKVVAVKDGGYKLNIDLRVVENGKKLPDQENVQLIIKSNVQADLADFKDIIQKGEIPTTANYHTIKGDTRFETAIEISKEAYKQDGKAGAVVLVGENAVVDGLASAPLAKKENAPILLTKKDAIPAETMKEIKRLVAKGAPIYLIGGENTISKSVEVQLAKEMNANIKRLSGDDRYDTSLKIAKELKSGDSKSNATKAFVVGGDGLADAMSVAAVAATGENVNPIIVTPSTGLTRDAKVFLDDENNTIASVDVVGGVSKISTQVLKDVNEIENNKKAIEVVRVSGADRNDTNAKVIAKYSTKQGLKNVYVAKDGDAQLVDALAAAPYAAKNDGVIVLATNDLTKAQVEELKLKNNDQKVTQIGGGIASVVIQKVLKAVVK